MSDKILPSAHVMHLSKKEKGFWWNVKKTLLIEKLLNPIGITLLVLLAAFIAVGIAKFGMAFGALFWFWW